jgi:DNA-binding transcriptional LysR family regulator
MRHLTHLKYIDVVAREGSIRKAAEKLNITSTALNRRILALEDEVGTTLFERLPSGVRLNTAGELFIQHIRYQMTDLSRVLSQISDLSGVRRGHINVAAGPELTSNFLPEQIGLYRQQFNAVSFDIKTANAVDALNSLRNFETDLALIFDSVLPSDIQIVATVEQPLYAFMHETHPLASKSCLRLHDCIASPVIMPSEGGGIRTLLDVGQLQTNIALEEGLCSDNYDFMLNYVRHEAAIGFHIPMGFSDKSALPGDIIFLPIDKRDVPAGVLHLVQTKGRVLPVAVAKFLDQMLQSLNERFPDDIR